MQTGFYNQARTCFKENLNEIGVPVPLDRKIEFNLSSGLDCLVDAIQSDLLTIQNQLNDIAQTLRVLAQNR